MISQRHAHLDTAVGAKFRANRFGRLDGDVVGQRLADVVDDQRDVAGQRCELSLWQPAALQIGDQYDALRRALRGGQDVAGPAERQGVVGRDLGSLRLAQPLD